MQFLRDFSLCVTLFIDDILSPDSVSYFADHSDQLLHTSDDLGFVVNFEESQLVSSRSVQYYTASTINYSSDKVSVGAQS